MTFQNLVDKKVGFEFLCLGQSEVGAVFAAILTLVGISIDNIIYELNRKKLNMGPDNVKWYYRLFFIGLYTLISIIVKEINEKRETRNIPQEVAGINAIIFY